MKRIFIIALFALAIFQVIATLLPIGNTYYIDPTLGSDGSAGTSTEKPWQSIAKVNAMMATMPTGSVICFKAGTVSYGAIVCSRSDITIQSYGLGPDAEITGFKTVTGLTSAGGGKYGVNIPEADFRLNMVLLNDSIVKIARWPDEDSTGLNDGWLRFNRGLVSDYITDHSPDSTTIIGANIGPNYPGPAADTLKPMHMVMKSQIYTMYNLIKTAKRHDSLDYKRSWAMTAGGANNLEKQPTGGRGFYFTRDSNYISKRGEYYLDSVTKRFLIKGFGTVQASLLFTGISVGSRSNITIRHLKFTGFNGNAIEVDNGNNLLVEYCEFKNIGGWGVKAASSANFITQYCTIADCLGGAISDKSPHKIGAIVRGNTISNIGLIKGQGSFYQSDYNSIFVSVESVGQVDHNIITNSGKSGIVVNGDYVVVEYNSVDGFCMVLMDAGAIYSYNVFDVSNPQHGIVVRFNFTFRGLGNTGGCNTFNRDIAHYYFDGSTDSVQCYNNTAVGVDTLRTGYAFQTNDGQGMNFYNNISYNIPVTGLRVTKNDTTPTSCRNVNNVYYSFSFTYAYNNERYMIGFADNALNGYTILQSLNRSFYSDSNFYNRVNVANFSTNSAGTNVNRTLPNYQTYSGNDTHSTTLKDYNSDSAVLFTNPTDKAVERILPFRAYNPIKKIYKSGKFTQGPWESDFYIFDKSVSVKTLRAKFSKQHP